MGEILQSDLEVLQQLGQWLDQQSNDVLQMKITDTVTMPDSPLQGLSGQVGEAVTSAFTFIGDKYRQLSEATKTAAKSYEELDQAFGDQLRRYTSGEQSR